MLEFLLPTLLLLYGGFHAERRLRRKDTVHPIDLAIWMTSLFFGIGPWVAFAMSSGEALPKPASVVLLAYLGIASFLAGLSLGAMALTSGANRRARVMGTMPAHSLRLSLLQSEAASIWPVLVSFAVGVAVKFYVGIKYGRFIGGENWNQTVDWSFSFTMLYLSSTMLWRGAFLWGIIRLTHRPRRHFIISLI